LCTIECLNLAFLIDAKYQSVRHGCSTLSDFEQFEEWLQSCECGAVSVLSERFGSVCHEDVESEAAHAGEHGWV